MTGFVIQGHKYIFNSPLSPPKKKMCTQELIGGI